MDDFNRTEDAALRASAARFPVGSYDFRGRAAHPKRARASRRATSIGVPHRLLRQRIQVRAARAGGQICRRPGRPTLRMCRVRPSGAVLRRWHQTHRRPGHQPQLASILQSRRERPRAQWRIPVVRQRSWRCPAAGACRRRTRQDSDLRALLALEPRTRQHTQNRPV